MITEPFSKAEDYRAAGWTPIRLEPGTKWPPPDGCTGGHPDPTAEMVADWAEKPNGNIALRLPLNVVGIDVDHYDEKRGGDTLAALEAELGQLPQTAISSSRDGVSGIRLFRVPEGLRWPREAGQDIDIVRHGHRYAVVWPSIHDKTGQVYHWVGENIPTVAQLAELPDRWVAYLTGGEVDDGGDFDDDQADEILTEGEMCQRMARAAAKYGQDVEETGNHHKAMISAALSIVRLGEKGHTGSVAALNQLHDEFTSDVSRPDGSEVPEYRRGVDTAIRKVLAEPTKGPKRCCVVRPQVEVTNEAVAADWLRRELGRGPLAGIYRRDDVLVHTPRMGEEGYLPPETIGLRDAGPAQVRPISTMGVKSLLETRYELWRETRVGIRPALFPQPAAQSACEGARIGEYAPNLKDLHGVTHTPMMRADGTILAEPGYDEATGFLYLPEPGLVMPPIPDRPTAAEIKAARELILAPIAEFPFVTEDDRATWIGLAFTPALRPVLPPPYQLGVITATNPGTGKTKLTRLISGLHGGVQRGELPREADELRKSITAALMDTTAPVVCFDNLSGVVRSSVLESLLTTTEWTDRWLGQNKSVTAPNDRLWLATGNNAAFGGDLARRIATVALDPPEANHHLRTDFRLNLDTWWPEHREKMLAAILTIARGWVVAGRPSIASRSDDYALWVNSLRGMLDWAGFEGLFGGANAETAMSSDDEEWQEFLGALHECFGDRPFTVKQLVDGLGREALRQESIRLDKKSLPRGVDPANLPGDLASQWAKIHDGRDQGFRKSLGWWLRNRTGRYVAGWALVAELGDRQHKVASYTVKPPPGFAGLASVTALVDWLTDERHAVADE